MDESSLTTATATMSMSSSSQTGVSALTMGTVGSVPTDDIFVPKMLKDEAVPPPEEEYRAIHKIRLSALQHNFAQVEHAASQQCCSVITVVKADGYGHGAIASALHLADCCGADAFAVATLDEAIALRLALERNPPGRWSKQLAALFHTGGHNAAGTSHTGGVVDVASSANSVGSPSEQVAARVTRPTKIRILVLGPPVGFPRCFDDYYHHNIEVMVSGPEVARSLMEWVVNAKERKRLQVERAARESQANALLAAPVSRMGSGQPQQANDPEVLGVGKNKKKNGENFALHNAPLKRATESMPLPTTKRKLPHASSTLGNVSGSDLANEVRTILMKQKEAMTAAADAANSQASTLVKSAATSTAESEASSQASDENNHSPAVPLVPIGGQPPKNHILHPPAAQLFEGLESAARTSRNREEAATRRSCGNAKSGASEKVQEKTETAVPALNRKRLRWHALVDSGMGRLGFKTEPIGKDDASGSRDTVDVLREMVDAEISGGAPIEFYGMCTHMAEASSTSTYTHSQIARFIELLKRVRRAGIDIHTVSTDNSSALLTTNLTHFEPEEILSQPGSSDTRGFVRTGGAIYGQRPAFTQLRAVSTLMASVRHIAILQQGESVGYDRQYIAPYNVRIATITIGFADGYPRELGNGVGKVQIRGRAFPVAGNVCMDMLMVEIGPAEESSSVSVGDTAVLWGPVDDNDEEGLVRLHDIAATLKTTQSALTCGLDKIRVRRKFV